MTFSLMEFRLAFPYSEDMKKILVILFLGLGIFARGSQAAAPYISVGTAHTKKTIVAFPQIQLLGGGGGLSAQARTISETITNDLSFMDLFRFLSSSAYVEDQSNAGLTPDKFKYSDWSSVGAEFLIKAGLSVAENGNLALEAFLYDTQGSKQIISRRYVGAQSDARLIGHTFANNIVEALTGLPGIFLTKLAMSCDRSGKKEIYVMNYDGSDVKQVTNHHSIAFAPAWSPDSTKIAYSLFAKHKNNIKNIDLYEIDFNTESYHMLSNRKGINSGAAYSPDGTKIALTMSFLGNPEIFWLDPKTSQVTRMTKSFGFDVDPAWSPDGSRLAFVSSRTGIPMVFAMNVDGKNVQRLTYAGRYNATPTWSPQNNKMGFAGWIDGRFDIFLMNPDGTHIDRLTKNQGNNEDPFLSPDGSFFVFSSNRTGQANIYVMNIDGTFVKRLTYGLGNCVAPKWSNPPRAPKPTAKPAG